MIDRLQLHQLVDTLPDAALEATVTFLQRLQTWPPEEPPQIRAIREANTERMGQSIRSGTGGGIGGGAFTTERGGRIKHGHQSQSHWEGDAAVIVTHRFHAGHELVIEERLRLSQEGNQLEYLHAVTGPDGTEDRRSITFQVTQP
jgi:hypothetical protein